MDVPPPRIVTLLLCTRDGRVLGTLPTFEVGNPWWPDSLAVVETARERYDVDVTILRLIDPGEGGPPGGPVTYLAELAGRQPFALRPWSGLDPLAEQPNRLPYARPGGPAAEVAWADGELARLGRPRIADAVQLRSWNLSTIWRLPTAAGTAWLKVVPPFFGHEGPMLELLGPVHGAIVPQLLAYDGCRILLDDIAGEDRYDAPLPERLLMVSLLVQLQQQWPQRISELESLGLPDWRNRALPERIAYTFDRAADELDAATRTAVASLLANIHQRYADIAACGIPDTLVHGDFHSGNTRGDAHHLVLLDWGDCGIGNPLLDQAAFLDGVRRDQHGPIQARWTKEWQAAVPGCDPEQAALLVEPLAAMRQAVIYRTFLDGIEPDEHIYHRDDPAHWLRRAASLAGVSPTGHDIKTS